MRFLTYFSQIGSLQALAGLVFEYYSNVSVNCLFEIYCTVAAMLQPDLLIDRRYTHRTSKVQCPVLLDFWLIIDCFSLYRLQREVNTTHIVNSAKFLIYDIRKVYFSLFHILLQGFVRNKNLKISHTYYGCNKEPI